MRLDPPTYGVDLLKHLLLPGSGGEFPPELGVLGLGSVSALARAAASTLFGREEHLARILLNAPPRRRGS